MGSGNDREFVPPLCSRESSRSSPEINLVLLEGCWLLFCFLSPCLQCVVEVSVANRNGALEAGGKSAFKSFSCFPSCAPARAGRTSKTCVGAEYYTCGSRAAWPSWPLADRQSWHPANAPVSRSR